MTDDISSKGVFKPTDEQKAAVMRLQQIVGIEPTGELDVATIRQTRNFIATAKGVRKFDDAATGVETKDDVFDGRLVDYLSKLTNDNKTNRDNWKKQNPEEPDDENPFAADLFKPSELYQLRSLAGLAMHQASPFHDFMTGMVYSSSLTAVGGDEFDKVRKEGPQAMEGAVAGLGLVAMTLGAGSVATGVGGAVGRFIGWGLAASGVAETGATTVGSRIINHYVIKPSTTTVSHDGREDEIKYQTCVDNAILSPDTTTNCHEPSPPLNTPLANRPVPRIPGVKP